MSGSIAKAWSDDRIADGVDWEKEIFEAIDGARVAVLLVTANFLTSDFILQKETPRFLGRSAEKRGVRAYPESHLNLVLVRFMTSIHQAWDASIPNL